MLLKISCYLHVMKKLHNIANNKIACKQNEIKAIQILNIVNMKRLSELN